jgi:predicted lipase
MKYFDFNAYFNELEKTISDLKFDVCELRNELDLVKKVKQAPKKKFYNTSEAAEYLNLSTQTIRNYVYSGKLSCLKGEKIRCLKFTSENLDDFVKNQLHYKKSDNQIKMEAITDTYTNTKLQTNWKK